MALSWLQKCWKVSACVIGTKKFADHTKVMESICLCTWDQKVCWVCTKVVEISVCVIGTKKFADHTKVMESICLCNWDQKVCWSYKSDGKYLLVYLGPKSLLIIQKCWKVSACILGTKKFADHTKVMESICFYPYR